MNAPPVTQWFSLRRRLLFLLLTGISVAWLVTLVLSYADAHHEVDELFDAQLAQAGQTLLALAAHAQQSASAQQHSQQANDEIRHVAEVAHAYQRELRFQIWRADGSLLLRSQNAPATPLTTNLGFSEHSDSEAHWRFFSQWDEGRYLQVQVAENHHVRDELVRRIAWRVLLPALFVMPLLAIWVWFATRETVASLDAVAGQITTRAPPHLSPVIPPSAPQEIRPLVQAINALFERVELALANEKRFTADAAHELRTPLAGLQAQLQVALRARDQHERQHSLQQLQTGLARASRLVEQMLLLARLDPQSALPHPETVDLHQLCATVCAELGAEILAKDLDFSLEILDEHQALPTPASSPPFILQGQADWLHILLRNLLDNAIRYTPEHGELRVGLARNSRQNKAICLEISNSGAGLTPEQRTAALHRFTRFASNTQPGSGLGLSIVARIAELHNATLHLEERQPAPGLTVKVVFMATHTNR